jgi:hypothetical protein
VTEGLRPGAAAARVFLNRVRAVPRLRLTRHPRDARGHPECSFGMEWSGALRSGAPWQWPHPRGCPGRLGAAGRPWWWWSPRSGPRGQRARRPAAGALRGTDAGAEVADAIMCAAARRGAGASEHRAGQRHTAPDAKDARARPSAAWFPGTCRVKSAPRGLPLPEVAASTGAGAVRGRDKPASTPRFSAATVAAAASASLAAAAAAAACGLSAAPSKRSSRDGAAVERRTCESVVVA